MFGIDIIDAGLLPAMIVALTAGIISFLSPCVLPIVPPYLAYMSGVSLNEIEGSQAARRKAIVAALFFVLGLSTVFLFLGFTASAFGAFFLQNQQLFRADLRRGGDRVRGAFSGRLPHSVSGPRGADRCRRPGRPSLRGLYAGAGLCLWLDALHRPATGRDPVAGCLRGVCCARHHAAGSLCAGAGVAVSAGGDVPDPRDGC